PRLARGGPGSRAHRRDRRAHRPLLAGRDRGAGARARRRAPQEEEPVNRIAIQMLVGDRAKYIGILIGLTFPPLLITQQASIFWGLMTRTYGAITDMGQPDIWVMDPKVQFIDDVKPMQSTELYRVRGVEGVQWATPLYKGLLKARLSNGNFQ